MTLTANSINFKHVRIMKQIVGLIILFIPLLINAQGAASDESIKWSDGVSWQEVKARAKTENKFIFVDCYASWCIPCQKMDREVYPDKTVGNFINSRFISIKMQFDSTVNDTRNVKNWFQESKVF